MVDWSPGAMTGKYSIVRNRINDTAIVVAQSINFLIQNNFTSYKNCSIVGHSLGSYNNTLTFKCRCTDF